jgi:hypothetical protein
MQVLEPKVLDICCGFFVRESVPVVLDEVDDVRDGEHS